MYLTAHFINNLDKIKGPNEKTKRILAALGFIPPNMISEDGKTYT